MKETPNARPVENAYRHDIDGLRAIAVASVIIYHAQERLLPGGFLGVDIFFVISGYLISKHIASDSRSGNFSVPEFYRRRVRRIAPMMLVTITFTLLISSLTMTPEDFTAVAKSAVWSAASLANVHFWRNLDTSYFASNSQEIPLLHLWSLGVEEQFYIVWPLILAGAVRSMPTRLLLVAIAGLALLSFSAASSIFPHDPMFAYYMLPTRAGELLVGGLLGVASSLGHVRPSASTSRMAGIGGATLIAGSIWLLDRSAPFPGWLALPPTIGAALLIASGEGRNGRPLPGLSSAPLVFIGQISYSAYLWHWPLFSLYRYGYGEPSLFACIVIISLTILLAWASYNLIELPARKTSARFRLVLLRQYLAPSAAVVLCSLIIIYGPKHGFPVAPDSYLRTLERVRDDSRPAYSYRWICQHQNITRADLSDDRCIAGGGGENPQTSLLLWGDSNAAHYAPMIREFAAFSGYQFRNIAIGSCPPLLSDPKPYVEARRLDDCRESNALISSELKRFPVIAVSAAWTSYQQRDSTFLSAIRDLAENLSARGHRVILIGKAHAIPGYDRRCEERALRIPLRQCAHESDIDDAVEATNRLLKDIAEAIPNVAYFDANSSLCPNRVCRATTPEGLRLYFDATHLTVPGSSRLGRIVLETRGLPAEFSIQSPR